MQRALLWGHQAKRARAADPWYNGGTMRFLVALFSVLTALVALPSGRAAAQAAGDAGTTSTAPGDETPTETPDATETPPIVVPVTEPTEPAGPRRRLVVIDVATHGIDPIVGHVATLQMRTTGAEMGYDVLDAEHTVSAATQLRMPYPPTPADLWRVTWVAQAHRGAFARIWADQGQYVVEIVVASLDGTGPFFGRATATTGPELRDAVARLLREALPLPETWQEEGAAAQQRAARPRRRVRDDLGHPAGIGMRFPDPPFRRWQITLQTEAVVGTTQGSFYNHFVGARLDVRLQPDLLVGVYFAYGNLQGRDDRAHNVFVMVQGEYRLRPSSGLDLTIPLRVGLGYLPYNGPTLRISAGLNYPISEDFEIGADLVAPTFWFLPNEVAVSMDFSLEVTYRFPWL